MFKNIKKIIKNIIKIDIKKLYYKKYYFTIYLKGGIEIKTSTENITLYEFEEILTKMKRKGFVDINEEFYFESQIEKIELDKTDFFEWYDVGGITNLPPITTSMEKLEENNKKYEKYL